MVREDRLESLVSEKPAAHPAAFSIRYFDHDLRPPEHLLDWYHQIYKAVDDTDAQRNCALFAPRNYGKTVGTISVCPSWLVANFPEIRIGILSHKKGHANKRAKMAVSAIQRIAERLDIEVDHVGKTTIQLAAGRENVEPTVEAGTIRSDDEGSHYDVVIYDDVATFGNQTTAHKDSIRRKFEDSMKNVAAKDGASCLPNGSVNLVIGTRKAPDDLYRQKILRRDDHNWDGFVARNEGQANWNARLWRITPNWEVIENEAYTVTGDDGEIYESLRALPEDIAPIDGGITPTEDFDVLWPEFHPKEKVIFELATESSLHVWRCENQQNPESTKGRVLQLDWLRQRSDIPRQDYEEYRWYAGLDFANPENNDDTESDYWALAVIAHDRQADVSYVVDLWRDRGMSWGEAATEFVAPDLRGYPIGELLIESNFVGGEIADVVSEQTELNVTRSPSSGKKEDRLHSMANKFQQGRVKIADDLESSQWESFIQDEWLAFPDSEHEDRMDSIEIALRGPETSGDFVSPEEIEVF